MVLNVSANINKCKLADLKDSCRWSGEVKKYGCIAANTDTNLDQLGDLPTDQSYTDQFTAE